MQKQLLRRAVASIVLGLSLFVVNVTPASATHFLGGQLYWQLDSTFASPTHVRYNVVFEAYWRWSFQWPLQFPQPGQVFDPGSYSLTVQGTGIGFTVLLPQTVMAVNQQEDWMVAQSVRVIDVPKTALPVTLSFSGGDRASTLAEGNRDTSFQLRTVIPPNVTRSPRSTMLPRVYLQAGQPAGIQMPNIPSPGAFNTFEFAPIADSLLRLAQPVGAPICTTTGAPNPACVCPGNAVCTQAMQISQAGMITWLPQVPGLYAVQFKIVSRDANGAVVASTPFDMVFSVLQNCPTCVPPVFNPPPPQNVSVTAGQPVSIPIRVTSAAQPAQSLSVAHTPLPAGATFTVLSPQPLSPLDAVLQWTPTEQQLGPHTVCFQATQSNGLTNIGQVCTTINVMTNAPPVLQCVTPAPATPLSPAGAPVTVLASVIDPEGAAMNISWAIGATTFSTTSLPAGAGGGVEATHQFPIGTTQVTVTASDGVKSSSCTIPVTVLKINQQITFIPASPVPFGSGPVPLIATTTSLLPVELEVLSGPGQLNGHLLSLTGVGSIELKASQDGDGIYAAAAPVMAMILVRDTTPPLIDEHDIERAEAVDANGAVVNYTTPLFFDDVDGPGTATCSPVSGSLFPRGDTLVTCNASDAAGNNSAATTFIVRVADTAAPSIGSNADITLPATGASGAMATFATPSASDNVDGSLTAVCTPASGSTFPIGATPVTCTATDSSGNDASSTFTVTVTNNAPTVSVPAAVAAEATSSSGAAVTFAASASDVEDGSLGASCTPANGSVFGFGVTPVSCSATDAHGATTSASFNVTVQDTTAPAVTYSGNAGTYAVGQAINITCTATDAVGVVSNTCATITGPAHSFPTGVNTFTATATDAASNTGSATVSFTVLPSLSGLQQLVNSFCDNPGICNALNAKLQAAEKANNANARAGQLGAFVNQVQAQTGKCLTAEEASILLQLVQSLF